MSKEIKVKLYQTMNDSYNELWQVISKDNKKEYYARHVYGDVTRYEWCYVSDPLGYCELDRSVEPDVIFIICDPSGNELFRSSNFDSELFPTLEEVSLNEWLKIKNNHSHITENTDVNFYVQALYGETSLNINKWLLTFKDIDLYGSEADIYDENWIYFRKEQIKSEVIHEYNYLGIKKAIHKITYKHKVCGAEWSEYYSGSLVMEEHENYIKCYASYYDINSTGAVYPKSVAIGLVTKSLKDIYGLGENNRILSSYSEAYGCKREVKHCLHDAAKSLLIKSERIYCNRNFVDQVIKNESIIKNFFRNIEEIRELHGKDVQADNKIIY